MNKKAAIWIYAIVLLALAGFVQAVPLDDFAVFDGSGDKIVVPDTTDFEFGSGNLTIDFWLRFDSNDFGDGTNHLALGKTSGGGNPIHEWRVIFANGYIYFTSNNNANFIGGSTYASMGNKQWHHFAFVRQGASAGDFKVYQDGALSFTDQTATSMQGNVLNAITATSHPLMIMGATGDAGDGSVKGYVDGLRIFNGKALSAAEVLSSYQRGLQNLTPNINQNLTAYWSFDNGYADLTGRNNDGVPYGDVNQMKGAKFRFADSNFAQIQGYDVKDVAVYDTSKDNFNSPLWKIGDTIGRCAMSFDGNADYVGIGNVADLNFAGASKSFSVSAWVKLDKWADSGIISKWGGGGYQWLLFSNSGFVYFDIWDGAEKYSASNTPLKVGEWYHIVGVANNGVNRMYINGVQQSVTGNYGTIGASTSSVIIGSYNSAQYLNGSTDEIMVFNRALTQDEVSTVYQRGLVGLKTNITDSLVASYGFDECGGTNVTDESGNSNHGLRSEARWKEKHSWYVEGKSDNRALMLDGVSSYVNAGGATDFQLTTNATISVWIKPIKYSGDLRQDILAKSSGGWADGYTMIFEPTSSYNHVNGWFRLSSGWYNAYDPFAPPLNQWTHYVYTYDSKRIRMWRNGIEVNQADTPDGELILTSTEPLNIGRVGGAQNFQYFNGSLDNVRIYNRTMSDQEIKDLYTRELMEANTSYFDKDPYLMGYYNFNNLSNLTQDSSARNNQGIPVSNAKHDLADYFNNDYDVFGGSAYFDGSSYPMSVTANSDFVVGTGAFTIEHWVYVSPADTLQQYAGLFGAYVGATCSWFTELSPAGSGTYGFYDCSGTHTDTGVPIKLGKWNHFAFVREGTGTNQAKLYLDGELIYQWTIAYNFANNNKVWIGAIDHDTYPGSYHFRGSMDEVKFFKRALSAQEIKEEYNAGLQHKQGKITDSLYGYWGFNGDTTDESDRTNNVVQSGANIQMVREQYGGSDYSVYDSAAYFDGSTDYVSVGDDSAWTFPADLSIELWAKGFQDSDSCYDALIGTNYWSTAGTIVIFQQMYTNVPTLYVDGNSEVINAATRINDGRWHHIVATRSSGVFRLYVDGKQEGSTHSNSNSLNGGYLRMGYVDACSSINSDTSFKGALDEVKIYNGKALSLAEINQSYYRGLNHLPSNITDNLVAYYGFNGDLEDEVQYNRGSSSHLGTRNGNVYLVGRTGKKAFPSKSYLVVTSKGLDIIDANTSELWMRAASSETITYARHIRGLAKSTAVLNGVAYVGQIGTDTVGSYGMLTRFDFVNDQLRAFYNANSGYRSECGSDISSRNCVGTFIPYQGEYDLVNSNATDLSLAVINNNTFLAVATDGGITIINESSKRAVDGTYTVVNTVSKNIFLTDDGEVYSDYVQAGRGAVIVYRRNAHLITGDYSYGLTYDKVYEDTSVPRILGTNPNLQELYITQNTSTLDPNSNTIYIATDQGATVIQEKQGDESNGNSTHYISGGEVVKQAAVLNGANSYGFVSSTPNIDGGSQMTFEVWVYPLSAPSGGNYYQIMTAGDTVVATWATEICRMYYYDYSGPKFFMDCGLDNGASTYIQRGSSNNYPPGKWYHVVGVFNSGTLNIYVNGVLDNGFLGGPGGSNINNGAVNIVYLGAQGNAARSTVSSYLPGYIDEARIYNRALSGSEALQSYQDGIAGRQSTISSSNLAGYWNFNDNSTDFSDKSGNLNHAAAYGDTYVAYPIIKGSSNNVTSIYATTDNIMYVGTSTGAITAINIRTNKVVNSYNSSQNGLVSNRISVLAPGSLVYGTESSGAGILEEQSVKDIFGWVKTTTGWIWQKLTSDSIVTSGNQYNWSWRQYQYNSGRKTISGTQYNWSWVDE